MTPGDSVTENGTIDAGEEDGGPGILALWQETLPALKRVIAALGCPHDAAEDVLQDAYLAGTKYKPGPGDRDGLRRWLFRVTINRCHLESRRRTRRRKMLLRLAARAGASRDDSRPEQAAARRDETRAVRAAVAALDDTLKAPLVLRYFEGMNSREIAEILEIPDGTVRRRLRTARLKLAAELRKAGYDSQ